VALIVLVSAKGSPGATTAALALAAVWPRPVLLAELDPAGGDIAAGFLRADARPSGGLLEVALAARRDLAPAEVLARCLRLSEDAEGVLLLPGLVDPGHAAALAPVWPQVAAALRGLAETDPGYDVLADAGRAPAAPALVAAADRVLLVLRPTLVQVHHAGHQLADLRHLRIEDPSHLDGPADGRMDGAGSPAVGLLLVGDRPYGPSEVQAALGAPLAGVLAHDPRAASALTDGTARGRWFDRSPLVRSARQVAATIARPGPAHRADNDEEAGAGGPSRRPRAGQRGGQPGGQRGGQRQDTGLRRVDNDLAAREVGS
jgi:hypothetical protein